MSDTPAYQYCRRDFLFVLGASMAPAWLGAKALNSVEAGYFAQLRIEAGLTPLAEHVKSVLRNESPETLCQLMTWADEAGDVIKSVVGDQWHTLRHTIPGLVDDDLLAGRTREVQGLHFTATELAMLLSE